MQLCCWMRKCRALGSRTMQLRKRCTYLALFAAALTMQACKDSVDGPAGDGGQTRRTINRMLFISDRETPRRQQLYSMRPDGSDIRRITYPKDSIEFYYATWSPDLSKLAVVWDYYDLRHREYPSLAILDSSGNFLYALADYCHLTSPFWSPDGREIAFSRPASYFGGVRDVYVVASSGGPISKVTQFTNTSSKYTNAYVSGWPEHNLLLVRLYTDSVFQDSAGQWNYISEYRISEMDLQGSIVKTILFDPPIIYYQARMPADGLNVAYLYNDHEGHSGVGIVTRDGRNRIRAAPELNYLLSQGWYQWLSWSPDGSQLSFSAIRYSRPPFAEIYIVNNDGTGLTTLLSDGLMFNYVADWR